MSKYKSNMTVTTMKQRKYVIRQKMLQFFIQKIISSYIFVKMN